jgi:hypothetical protein
MTDTPKKKFEGEIFTVDFDGTCTKHRFPDLGDDIGAAPVLRRIVEEGGKIILWTMRSGKHLDGPIEWYKKNNIPLWAVNKNPQQHHWTSSPKAFSHYHIDDTNVAGPVIFDTKDERGINRYYVDWEKIATALGIPDAFEK